VSFVFELRRRLNSPQQTALCVRRLAVSHGHTAGEKSVGLPQGHTERTPLFFFVAIEGDNQTRLSLSTSRSLYISPSLSLSCSVCGRNLLFDPFRLLASIFSLLCNLAQCLRCTAGDCNTQKKRRNATHTHTHLKYPGIPDSILTFAQLLSAVYRARTATISLACRAAIVDVRFSIDLGGRQVRFKRELRIFSSGN